MEQVITSRQNSMVKEIRGLRDKRLREAEGLYFIEGAKMLYEAVVSGVCPEKILVSDRGAKLPLTEEIVARCLDTRIIRVNDQVMDHICETETPQGIGAVMKMASPGLEALELGSGSMLVILDGVQDPGNAGTIIRTADAFGADAVIMTKGCVDLYNSKALRSTMGSVFHLPIIRDVEIPELARFLRDRGLHCLVTGPEEKAVSLEKSLLPRPLAIVLGGEARGVSADLRDLADNMSKIPMEGMAESLNVAVAAGIILYEAFRQHRSNVNETCK